MPHPEKGMHDGCCLLWTKKNYRYVNIQHDTIEGLRGVHGFSPDIPWRNLSQEAKDLILFGSDDPIADVDRHTRRKVSVPRKFPGFLPEILRRAEGKKPAKILTDLITEGQCPECEGTRWSREARALRLGNWHVHQILGIPFDNLKQITRPGGSMEKGLPRSSRSLVTSLHTSACAFVEAGLGHISGERGMTTLSEGESRRSRLAMLLHTPGEGLALLLDERHEVSTKRTLRVLSCALAKLKHRHTLVISEHRTSLAKIADELIQVGPGAGENGGQIVYQGLPKQSASKSSQKSSARTHLPVNPKTTRLTVTGANIHTLSSVSCSIPLGRLVSITGVSGSGKSCFIRGILVPALAEKLSGPVDADDFAWPGGTWNEIRGFERISSVLALEPKTPGENRRSTLATYLKLADDLRNNFGHTSEARHLGLQPTDFGWNAGQGRCQNCLGLGELEDAGGWVTCPSCGGSRFGTQTLSVRLHGQSIADILNLPLTELLDHPLANEAGWRPLLKQLIALDLGYLSLGRRLDRISGGEHQRLRIAHTLSNSTPEGLLLILDEPSAGLHPKDVLKLLKVLDHIVANGANYCAVSGTQPYPDSSFGLDYRLWSWGRARRRQNYRKRFFEKNCKARHANWENSGWQTHQASTSQKGSYARIAKTGNRKFRSPVSKCPSGG